MSFSETVDEKYRISAVDLNGREHRLRVSNVSYQGLENLSPVLHFDGITKRLVLDRTQYRQMIIHTREAVPEDWIGASVVLRPTEMGGETTVVIGSPHGLGLPSMRATLGSLSEWYVWLIAAVLVICAIGFSAWYLDQYGEQIWELVRQGLQ